MRHLPEASEILAKIDKLHRQQADTLQQLNKSLHIRSIWPDAFLNGSRCTMRIGTLTQHEWSRFITGKREIDTGYLVRIEDGEKHLLTPEQFRTLHEMPGGRQS